MNKPLKEIIKEINDQNEDKSWTPRVITGGKGPPDYPGDPNNPDWLTPIQDKTIILIEHKKSTEPFALQCQILQHGMKSILLSLQGSDRPVWAIPMKFCREFRFVETLMSSEEFELELKAREKLENGNSIRSD